MSSRTIFNVGYDIPVYNVSLPGSQHRTGDGIMRITPSMTEVLEFNFGNQDGVPLILTPFKIKLVFWNNKNLMTNQTTVGQSDIVLAKEVTLDEPYKGRTTVVLTSDDTMTLGRENQRSLRWSLFMINSDEQIFPAQLTRTGSRYGTVHIDLESGIPIAELIKNAR